MEEMVKETVNMEAPNPEAVTGEKPKAEVKKEQSPKVNNAGEGNFFMQHKVAVCLIGLALIYIFLQLKYVYDVWFDPDELDIYTVAFEMVRGKVLYRDIPSQHMPFTYIFSTVFYFLGAHEAWLQRIYYYVVFSAFWCGFVVRYKKYINKWALMLHPILFFTLMEVQDFSTQILSENLVAIGAEIFVLEFIRFLKEKDIDLIGCILMSAAVMFTFGTTFIAIYPLFFLGLGVLLLEIKWGRENKMSAKDWWMMMLKRYGRLLIVVAIPWLIFVIYALATSSLKDFYHCAYRINRLYYPKYNDGVGGSAAGTFLKPIIMLAQEAFGINVSAIEPTFVLRWLCLFTGGLYFPYRFARKHGVIAGLTVLLFTLSLGMRGYFNYHGKAFEMVLCLLTAGVIFGRVIRSRDSIAKAGILRKGFLAVFAFLVVVNYSYDLNNLFTIFVNKEYNHYQYDTDYIEKLTESSERIWQTNMCDAIPWASKRVTTGPSVSCPWMWEGLGSQSIEEYKKDPARVIIFQLGYESWGHKMADYAPEAYYYIVNNYKYLPDSGQIWVLNEYYNEACEKVGVDPNAENDNGLSVTPYTVDPSEMPGMTYDDRLRYLEIGEEAFLAEKNGASEAPTGPEMEAPEGQKDMPEGITGPTDGTPTSGPGGSTKKDDKDTEDKKDEKETDEDSQGAPGSAVGPGSSTGPSGTIQSSDGPSSYGPGDSSAPNDVPSNAVSADTPGAIQAPDGSWIVPDEAVSPGGSDEDRTNDTENAGKHTTKE